MLLPDACEAAKWAAALILPDPGGGDELGFIAGLQGEQDIGETGVG